MAEGASKIDNNDASPGVNPSNISPDQKRQIPLSSRANKWKLTRSASKGWFNKSFDQSVLSHTGVSHHKPMRRQSSVSDFFQSMLTKSRTHFIGLFSGNNSNKESTRQSMLDVNDRTSHSPRLSPVALNRGVQPLDNDGEDRINHLKFRSTSSLTSYTNQHQKLNISPSRITKPDSLDMKDRHITEGRSSPSASPASMFIVSSSNESLQRTSIGKTASSPLRSLSASPGFNSQRHKIQAHETDNQNDVTLDQRLTREIRSPPYSSQLPLSRSITFSVVDFTDNLAGEESDDDIEGTNNYTAYRQISSAPAGRQSLSSESTFLRTNTGNSLANTKRALVKSNSDTITKFSMGINTLTKASSDGSCFRASKTQSPISNSVVSRITDYLFVGSVEAAYNEPLLCKYKITSLIDMTNIHPRVVPLQKKSDCPCACINKDHFRSKLNIGVDDIEWENLEQYYKEINAFIDGSRKKKGRTLIFSYMGRSRAPAAAIQHLMQRYEMSYREAFNIVVSKRPHTKLNPGFIKALKRLDVSLSQERDKSKALSPSSKLFSLLKSHDTSIAGSQEVDNVEKGEQISETIPPVVRGAWLEC